MSGKFYPRTVMPFGMRPEDLLDLTIAGYAKLHRLDTPALLPKLKAFFWHDYNTPTSKWWTVSTKPTCGTTPTHSIYNYGIYIQCDE